MKILIDNGHGNPPLKGGKCSPDNRLKEYFYCREIAQRVSRQLSLKGYDAILIVPEDTDTALKERVRRVNAWCNKLGSKEVVLVSIHNNAAGADGKWHDARGFSVFLSSNASSNSKKLAQIFTDTAISMNLMGNRSIPKEKYWVQSIAMTRDTKCPAVLTENLFQDNESDVSYLLSEEGKAAITKLHVDSIIAYINTI
jgi:N-acetylmuramoyl-L-alanine amidase